MATPIKSVTDGHSKWFKGSDLANLKMSGTLCEYLTST